MSPFGSHILRHLCIKVAPCCDEGYHFHVKLDTSKAKGAFLNHVGRFSNRMDTLLSKLDCFEIKLNIFQIKTTFFVKLETPKTTPKKVRIIFLLKKNQNDFL